MPSWFTHVPAALGAAAVVAPAKTTRRYWVTAAICGIIPDLDTLGALVEYQGIALFLGGHRGVTHSLPFAAVLGAAIAWTAFRDARWNSQRVRLAIAFALATITHVLLDAFTVQGAPIPFFSPFSSARYDFPWQPINPAKASDAHGFARLPEVLANELGWGALPFVVVGLAAFLWRSARRVRIGMNHGAVLETTENTENQAK